MINGIHFTIHQQITLKILTTAITIQALLCFVLHADCLELLESVWNRQLKRTRKSLIAVFLKKAAICILFAFVSVANCVVNKNKVYFSDTKMSPILTNFWLDM